METAMIYKTALTLHYIGFTMLAGTVLVDFVTSFQFWKLAGSEWHLVAGYWQMRSKFARLASIGALLLLIGGVTMIVIIKQAGAVKPQLWFQLKMMLLVLLMFNVLVIGKKALRRIKKLLRMKDIAGHEKELRKARDWLFNFHIIQLTILLVIFILAAFRFA